MSPARPGDPSQGQPGRDEHAELDARDAATEAASERAEASGAAAPDPARAQRGVEPEAAGSAAAVTGIDKAAAAAGEDALERVERAAGEAGRGDERSEADDERAEQEAEELEAAPTTPSAGDPGRGDERSETVATTPAPRRRDQRRSNSGVVVRAQAKYVRTSARKARLVCDHIRGKDVEQARAILAFTPRAAAEAWTKLLESAVANAEHNHELVGEELRIASVHADEGPTLKRFRPRAMGRATRIRKRTSHLTITLTPKE